MKKLLALLMAVAVTFQLVTPVFADTEGTEETTAPTEAVVETEAPTEAPAEETTAPTEATEEAEEATEETVEDIALFADDGDVIASGVCGENGDNLTWVLTGDGTLTISGSGEMEDYSQNASSYITTALWGTYWEQITAVVLEPDVTSIGDYAFSHCRLTSVMIPDGVISIGSGAFNRCSSLTSVTIPDGVTDISRGAFSNCSSLTSVTIPDSVTSIGDFAFCGCRLTSVAIPEGVTSIGGDAFCGCSSLTSVTIPDGVTSIGDSAFSYCSKLEDVYYGGDDQQWKKIEIEVNNNDLTNATIHYAFSHIHDMVKTEAVEPTYWSVGNNAYYTCFCGKVFKDANGETETTVEDETLAMLPSVAHGTCGDKGDNLGWVLTEDGTLTISGEGEMENYSAKELDGKYCTTASWGVYREQITLVVLEPGVTGIGEYAFRGCSSLTSVTISEGATSIGLEAFCDCGSLTSVTIPDGVTSIGDRAFYGCSNLTSVTIPESVTSIGSSAFLGCRSLTSVKIPEGVASIDDQVFRDCSSLASVTVPESITSIGNYAFLGCNSLTSVMIPDGVTSIGDSAFQDCSSLTSVTIPGSVTSIGEYAFNYCSSLTSVTISEGVASIPYRAFYGCSSLTSMTIPEGVTSIGDGAFWDCSSLTSVTIPESVTSIGDGAFDGCSSLTSVTIPEGVTSIGNDAFRGCSSLTSMTIPESVTSIGDRAFSGCSSLTSVTIPEGVTSISWNAFSGCSSLTSVTIPEGVTSIGNQAFRDCSSLTSVTIPKGVISIADTAFYGCSSLTSVTIPEGVTSIGEFTFAFCGNLTRVTIPESVTSIGEYAFNYCSSLTSVTIPDSVTSIGDAAFEACSGLTGVTIPDGVTSIGEKDFSCCISLTSVAIPESVTSIGDSAFDNCSKLKHVYYGGPDLQWAKIEIGVNNDALVNAIIHYGSSHIHNTEHIHEKAVSCTETGNLEYWLCSICGKYFTDETFTKSTDEAGVTLPALGHAMTRKKAVKPTHKTAGNIEYYICSRCGKLFKDALGEEETTLEEVTLPVIPYVSKIVLTRDGEPVPETMEVGGRTGDTLTFAAVVQPEGAETKVKWSSGTPAVAQVDQDGVVTLLTSGTTVIKAAATDGSRVTAQVTLNVIARDYAPRLGDSTLTLNSASSAGVSVDLVESYGNQILSVSVDDERFDVEYADSLLTLTSREAVARGTYRMTLEAACDDGRTYSYPITVRVIQTLPRLTVRQSQRFNLFYRDSQATLTITGGEVESAELTGNSDFVLENEDGEWVIRYADPENAPAKPSTRATLSVSFAGYNIPVTRALTIGTVNTAPKLKRNPTSSTLNTALNSDWSVETVLSGADGESLYAYTDTPGVDVALSGNVLTLTLTEAKNVSANVYVQDDNWTKPVKLTHRVTVTNRLPTLRAAAGTLKLNSWFPSETASTGMILSQGNVSLTDVELTPAAREGTAARAESDKLNVYYDADSGEIVAEIADSGIKNGTYSFACTGILESGTEISGGTVRVTVSNTLPRARLSAAMVRLNRQLAGEESIAVKVTLTGGDGYAIEGFEELPDCLDYADGILTATIPNADFTGGSYVLNAIVSRNGETATLPAGVILRVQVYDRAPSFRLTAKGKMDVLNPASEIVYTPRLTNAQGTVTDIRLEGADAELFAAEVVDGVVHLTMAKGCTYSTRTTYKVIPVLTFCGREVTGSTLSIRVIQSVLRLAKLSNRTVYQSQTAPLVQVLSITSPATAEFGEITLNSRSTAALRNAVEAAGGIEVSGGVVRIPAKAFASLKPGRYTVILDVTPENAAADAKPIQARFTLTVQK